jgi:hypothetical protein
MSNERRSVEERLERASVYRQRLRGAKVDELRALLRFFDCDVLRPYFSSFIFEVRDELARRGKGP